MGADGVQLRAVVEVDHRVAALGVEEEEPLRQACGEAAPGLVTCPSSSRSSSRQTAIGTSPPMTIASSQLLPFVDGVSLVDLASGYERATGFDVPGGYAGLVLDHFNFGDLVAYLTGSPEPAYWAKKGVIALLGCDCGEVGCWPWKRK